MEIIRDILRADSQGITELRCSVNLNHSQIQKYLALLEQCNLTKLERHNTRINVIVTDKGRRALRLLDILFQVLGDEDQLETGVNLQKSKTPQRPLQ